MEFSFDLQFEKMMQEHGLTRVVLLAHMNPDGDACGCVLGLAHYIHAVYPQYEAYPYLAETLDKGPKKQVRQDAVFDPFTAPVAEEPYAVIVCDTATKARMIGLPYYEKAAASLVMDHHASNEGYGDVNYLRISEACSENIYYALNPEKLKKAAEEPYPNACDYLYLGILHDTSGFSRANGGILRAGAGLLELGVDHRVLMATLQTQTLADKEKEGLIMSRAQRALGGQAAYVFVTHDEAVASCIEYEDIHPISGLLRDCEDVELGFTMYEEEPGIWRCSFRSDGKWINVNELLNPFGGGGHAGAAGLRLACDDPKGLLARILARAEQMRA